MVVMTMSSNFSVNYFLSNENMPHLKESTMVTSPGRSRYSCH